MSLFASNSWKVGDIIHDHRNLPYLITEQKGNRLFIKRDSTSAHCTHVYTQAELEAAGFVRALINKAR